MRGSPAPAMRTMQPMPFLPSLVARQKKYIMATIKEILNIEQTREDNTLIHLFAEGSFWRAYELSSWLCFRFVNEFKPTKRRIKGIDATVTFVGFPRQSLQKFIPADW